MGGDAVESAVMAVFAALIWHTQQLREDLQKFIGKNKNIIIQKCAFCLRMIMCTKNKHILKM